MDTVMENKLDAFVKQFPSSELQEFIHTTLALIRRLSTPAYNTQDEVYNDILSIIREINLQKEGQEVLIRIFSGRGEAL